jgi:mono/diheme cytochrome c family protein
VTLRELLRISALFIGLTGVRSGWAAEGPLTPLQLGEYLIHAGDCSSCHTSESGVFAGGVKLNTPFGYMLGPNITPDKTTGIGLWSSADFYRALHEGVNREGSDLYPTMPYVAYTKVSRADSDAMYAYLRTVAPVAHAVDVNHLMFPFNQRWTMGVWRALYFTDGAFVATAAKSAIWNRGAYLVEGLGHCSECHSPRNVLGAIKSSERFEGADIEGWYALNLSDDMTTGLGTWSIDDIVTYLKSGVLKDKTASIGPMAEVIDNSLRYMTSADLQAIATYLKSIAADSPLQTKGPEIDPTHVAGARLYIEHCMACHQAKGEGIPNAFPALVNNGTVIAANPADILNVMLRGIPVQHERGPMPAFAARLSNDQIASLANYMRTSWGNAAKPNVTAQMVEKLRSQVE